MASHAIAGGFSLLFQRPLPTLALWAGPAAVIAVLTVAAAPPALSLTGARPSPAETLLALGALAAQLFPQLFAVVLAAGPTALLMRGVPGREALAVLRRGGPWAVAAQVALLLTFALLLTLAPGLMALYVNPLMGLIFLTVGAIGGAALAVGLFARWMFAPALAAEGLDPAEALDASRAQARKLRSFGFAVGLAAAFALILGLAAGAGAAAAALSPGRAAAARVAAMALVLAPLLPIVPAKVAARHIAARAGHAPLPQAPALALRTRTSACPRCGAPVAVPLTMPSPVRCGSCGLAATLR